MADKTLNDVVDSLKSVEDTIKNPPKSAADKEAATEADRVATEERGIFEGIYNTLQKGFGAATTADKKQGGLIAGLLGGIGAGLGAVGKAVGNIGMGFAKGMIGLGAGIAGFAIAIGGASMILSLMGTDGSALTSIITNFFDAFSTENAVKMGVIVTIAGLLAGFKVGPVRFAAMMTAVAAGIVGFAGGILLGEVAAGYALKTLGGMDGGALAGLLNSFFGAMTIETAAGMGIIVTLAATAAALKTSGTRMAGMMTGIGAGIAGFAGGILMGSAIAGYGLTEMGGLDGGALAGLLNSFFGSMTAETAAGMGIVVALAAAAGKLNVGGLRMAGMMTGIGAGIAGFAGGILIGSAIAGKGLEAMGALDTTSLTSLLHGFFTAITPEIAAGMGIIVTLAGLAATLKITPLQMAGGMTAIGAGIAGFSLGILLGEGAAKLGAMAELDGSNLKTLMQNFMGAFDGVGFAVLGALIVAGAALGATMGPAALVTVPLGMGAIGAGIAAFMVPLVAADWIAGFGSGENLKVLLSNVGQAIGGFIGGIGSGIFKQLETIDTEKLGALGTGIKDLGLGMMAFAGGQAAGVVGGVMESVGSFFGKDSPLEQVAKLSKDKDINVPRLQELGLGIRSLAEGMSSFAAVDSNTLAKNAASLALTMSAAKGKEEGLFASTKDLLGSLFKDAATGGLITKDFPQLYTGGLIPQMQTGGMPPSAGIFELHQGEMVLDNKAVAAFSKSLDMVNTSQSNALAGMGGGTPIIVNNNNVDNSVQSSQTTAVSMPEPTRTNESTVRALQNG